MTRVVLTYKEYEALPADGRRYEILSPSTTLTDRVTKHQLYARHGAPYFWLVDPEGRMIDAFVLGPDGYTLAARVSGREPRGVPPFPDLDLVPDSLWL